MPACPTLGMKPGMIESFGPKRNDGVLLTVWLAACGAEARASAAGIAIHPLDDAAFERHGFCPFSGLPAIELGDAGPFVEERLPILSGPPVVIGDEQGDDFLLVAP